MIPALEVWFLPVPFRLMWAHVGSCGLMWAHVGSCGLMWAHVGSCGLMWAHVGSCGVFGYRSVGFVAVV